MTTLTKVIAPMIYNMDQDESAKRYDNHIYTMMLAALNGGQDLRKASGKLVKLSQLLKTKGGISAVDQQMPLIYQTSSPDYWAGAGIRDYEEVREKLLGLIKYITDITEYKAIRTNLTDEVTHREEGKPFETEEEYRDYKEEVNQYIHTHRDTTVIHKLTHNLPLTEKEYGELERILTQELGTAEDYERNYQDTPFGLLVRKIAGMDHDTVQGIFADFINQEKLNQRQINFANRVIAYIEKNGYIRETEDLTHAPFDFPAKIFELFDPARCRKLFEIITRMKENAEKHMA